jgi:hypothetical protein
MPFRELVSALLEIFGLSELEAQLIDARGEVRDRVRRGKANARRAVPYVLVTAALAVYAVVATGLAVRKLQDAESATPEIAAPEA